MVVVVVYNMIPFTTTSHMCIHLHTCMYAANKSQVTDLKPQTPFMIVWNFGDFSSSSSCPYAESQPGQLLAGIECFHQDNHTGESLNVSIMRVFKKDVLAFGTRTVLVPSREADIVLQRDHNSPRLFYLLLEHVSLVLPESNQEVAPTYEAYVQCTNGVSMATHLEPVTFCIKHSRLTTRLREPVDSILYKPATPYFTNVPREFHVFPNPNAIHGQLLFNVRVGVWNAYVPSYSIAVPGGRAFLGKERFLLRIWDTECQAYYLAVKSPVVVANNGEHTLPMFYFIDCLAAWLMQYIDTSALAALIKFCSIN